MENGDRYVYFVDVSKCYGCLSCVAACAAENNVPVGYFRTWVERYAMNGRVAFVPKICNHCDNPSCVHACPVNATYKTEEGLVLIDDEICIGCGACIQACPYGARFRNPVKGTADKCTLCNHRIPERLPACVESCPTSARVYGKMSDKAVKEILSKKNAVVLKAYTGNEPHTYYVSLTGVE